MGTKGPGAIKSKLVDNPDKSIFEEKKDVEEEREKITTDEIRVGEGSEREMAADFPSFSPSLHYLYPFRVFYL